MFVCFLKKGHSNVRFSEVKEYKITVSRVQCCKPSLFVDFGHFFSLLWIPPEMRLDLPEGFSGPMTVPDVDVTTCLHMRNQDFFWRRTSG